MQSDTCAVCGIAEQFRKAPIVPSACVGQPPFLSSPIRFGHELDLESDVRQQGRFAGHGQLWTHVYIVYNVSLVLHYSAVYMREDRLCMRYGAWPMLH